MTYTVSVREIYILFLLVEIGVFHFPFTSL